MTIKHESKQNRFSVYDDDGEQMGLIEYKPGGGNDLYATHTEVFPEFEGRGLAAKLLDALADYAREEDFKIVAICPYVIHAFKAYPDKYADVMKAS